MPYAKSVGFDFEHWRFAHRKFGHWITLPGKANRIYTMDYRLNALCTKCNTVHSVTLVNLRTGNSTQCRECAYIESVGRGHLKVECIESGDKFSSIMSASEEIDANYQKMRKVLAADGSFVHGGLTYQLVE